MALDGRPGIFALQCANSNTFMCGRRVCVLRMHVRELYDILFKNIFLLCIYYIQYISLSSLYIFTYLRPYTETSCGYMESHFAFAFEFEFELRLRLRTHGSRP